MSDNNYKIYDVAGEEQCPNCGTPINDDENEYVEWGYQHERNSF